MKNFELFKKICENDPGEYLSWELLEKGVRVNITSVNKVNVTHTGLTLIIPGQNLSPTTYVEHLYECFIRNESFSGDEGFDRNNIIRFLRDETNHLYHEAKDKNICIEDFLNPEYAKTAVYYQLINGPANKEMLKSVPHRKSLGDGELVIVYRLLYKGLEVEGDVMGSSLIHNALAEQMGFGEEDLYRFAVENTPKLFPPEVCSLKDMVLALRIYEDEHADEHADDYEDDFPLLIASNDKHMNGANVVLYDNFLANISEAMGEDLILLPASVHEFLITPYSSYADVQYCINMVEEVNRTCVEPNEKLSDHIFYTEERMHLLNRMEKKM